MVPCSFMTMTELSRNEGLSPLISMPIRLMKVKMPMIIPKAKMPTTVAATLLKNCFIMR